MRRKNTALWSGFGISMLAAIGLTFTATGCFIRTGGSSSGYSRHYRRTTHPTVRIKRFSGRRGMVRIHNTTGHTLRRVAVAVRGYQCYGPRPTITVVRTFNVYLRPGHWRTYNFRLSRSCKRVRVATAGR